MHALYDWLGEAKKAYGPRSLELSDEKVMCMNRDQSRDFMNGTKVVWMFKYSRGRLRSAPVRE